MDGFEPEVRIALSVMSYRADATCRLPFIDDHGSGLGIAVKTYLDAFDDEQEITETLKKTIKQQEGKYSWFQQLKSGGGLTRSLDQAWKIWDAVSSVSGTKCPMLTSWQIYAASQVPGADIREAKLFSEANDWLANRR